MLPSVRWAGSRTIGLSVRVVRPNQMKLKFLEQAIRDPAELGQRPGRLTHR